MSFKKLQLHIYCISILFLWCFLWFAPSAEAGLIVQRPLYIGLNSGLVGFWSFDQQDMAGERAYDRSGKTKNRDFSRLWRISGQSERSHPSTDSMIARGKEMSSQRVENLSRLDPRGFAPRRFSLTDEISNCSGPSQ